MHDGHEVPIQHHQYNGDEVGHTTIESCENKGRASWWMVAQLAGWSPAAPTPTPTPGGYPTCTPTPNTELQASIWMPDVMFHPSENFACNVSVNNTGSTTHVGNPLFVILDLWGDYYFAPGFSDFEYYVNDYPPGEIEVIVIPSLPWPAGAGSADNVSFYAAVTDPGITGLVSNLDMWTFGWSE